MGRTPITKSGLNLTAHQALARQCAELRAIAQAVRATVRDGVSSASEAYGATSQLLNAVKRVESTLLHELALEHGDALGMTTVRAVYHGNGEGG